MQHALLKPLLTRNRLLSLVASAAVATPPLALAQNWQQVINHQDRAGSGIGGGSGSTLYAGVAGGPVFRSTDNGVTWTPQTTGLADAFGGILPAKAFVVTPTGRVIRGGDNASWNNKVGSPIFYSDNQGATWTEVPLPFASSARNPAGIGVSDLVTHQGALYFSDVLSEGVWKSADNGLTWTAAGEGLPTAPFVNFAKTYYAVASAGDALLTVQASKGVFRSTDGGATWNQAVNGIPGVVDSPLVGGRTWNAGDVVATPDGTAFVVSDSRLYRSRDGGASWEEVGAGILQSPNPFAPTVIQPSARKVELLGDRVYVSTTDGNPRFFEGTVTGDSWTELARIEGNTASGSILAQSFYAHNGALYFAGTKGIHRLDLATATRTNIAPIVSVSATGPFGVNLGSTLQVAVTARGTAPFTFKWLLNGSPIAGQAAAALNFTASSTNESGQLSVVVSNAAGSATNVLGQLSVAPIGPGFIDYGFKLVNTANSLSDIIPLPVTLTTFAFGPDGSVVFGGEMYSSKEGYTRVRRVLADGTPDRAFLTGSSAPGATAGAVTTLLPLNDGSVLVGAAGTGNEQRYYRRMLPNGALDTSWPWPAEIAGGPRKIERLADGRLLVAGGSAGGIRRLNPDGTLDPAFAGPVTIGRFQQNYVSDFALLPGGHIVIVGRFDEVDGTSRSGIARLLPNGVLDRSWVPAQLPVNSATISAVAVLPDGKLLIGGSFTTVGGQPHRNLARLHPDGSLDTTLGDLIPNTSPAGTVSAFAVQPDGRVWIGGAFTGVSGRNYLFRLQSDGTVDTAFPDIGINGAVSALRFTPDGRLWIGGAATKIGGFAAGTPARIFTDISGPTVGYAGLDQTPDAGASITLNGIVPGPFTALQWRFKGAPIGGATGLELPLNNVTLATSGAYDLVVTSAGGSYTSAPVNVRVRGPVVIDQAPQPSVATISSAVNFAVSAFGKLPLAYQWLKDGEVLANATNRTLALTNLQLTATGDYSVRVSGSDGSTASSEPAFLAVVPPPGSTNANFRLALPVSNGFKDITFLPDGRAIVAGGFAGRLALVNSDGSVDPAFQFNPEGLTDFLALERQPDGKLLILVRLNTGGGPYAVRRLNADGSVDASFPKVTPVGNFPSDLKLAADGGILLVSQTGFERINPDGSPDAGFNQRARLNNTALSADVDPTGRIYVTGYFTTVGGTPRAQLARLLADGTLDASFAPTNTFSSTWTVRALPDGALIGDLNGFYRFTETGARDDSYGWGTRLAVWDLSATGQLLGALNDTQGNGVIRAADGTPALPFSTMKLPAALYGYGFLRVAPDGAIWLAKGTTSFSPVDSATLLYRLNGTITPLALLTSPLAQTVNAGTRVAFTAAATGTSKVSYQWQRNGVNLTGETNATLVFNSAQPANNGDYAVVVSNRSGSQTSRVATLVVLAAPEILSLSGGGELGLGNTLLLGVNARGVAPLAYQWRRNGAPLAGATAASYTNRAVALGDAGSYDVVVGNSLGSVTSAPVAVTVVVRPGAVITSFPTNAGSVLGLNELNVLPNGFYLLGGSAYNRFGELQFSLPYPYNGAPGTSVLRDRVAVDAANGRIYMGPTYAVRAFDLGGALVPAYAGPAANVRLVRVEAGGTVLKWTEGALTYTLKRLGPDGALAAGFTPPTTVGVDAQPLADGKILLLSASQRIFQNNFVFDTTVVRLNADGTLDSTFKAATNVFPLGKRAERLAVDRQGRFFVLGSFENYNGQARTRIARFLADGTLDPSFVQATINGEVMELAEQLNGKLVIVGAFTQVDGQPRSLVARLNADGSHDPSFNPGAGLTTTGGQNVAYDVALLPTGEILVAGTFNRADGLIRTGLALLTGDTTDLYFTREPADVELPVGGSAELVAAGTGTTAVTYQWFKGADPLAGQTAPALALSNVTAATAGNYRVVIRNESGELSSRTAKVGIILPPEVVQPPVSVVVNGGQATTFSVVADGLRLRYQWLFGDEAVANATNASLNLASVKAADAGRYSVRVFNPAGEVTAGPALLRLRPAKTEAVLPTNGLVGVHHFDGSLAEEAGRYNVSRTGASGFAPGYEGEAVRITTGSDIVQLGQGPPVMFAPGYTVSFWIKPEVETSLNVYAFVVGNREHYLFLGGNDNTTLGNRIFLATRGFQSVHSSDDRAYVPNLMGKWTHFMVTYNGQGYAAAGNYAVYVNGESLALASSSNLIGGSARSGSEFGRYGGGANGASGSFLLDEVRLYNQVLSANDARQLANPVSADPPPELVSHPAGGSAAAGGNFTFSVGATGEGLFYEWYRGDTLLPDADGPVLNLSNLSAADAGDYRVVISNSGGSTNSAVATLTVNAVVDPFAAWATAAGLSGPNATADADPDGDGFSNLAEFALGSSPTAKDQRPRFIVGTFTLNGEEFPTVTYTRRPNAGTVRIVVRYSNSLAFPGEDPAPGVGLSMLGDLEAVTVRSWTPVTGSPQQFFQIRVEP